MPVPSGTSQGSPKPLVVTNTNDSGPGSLREAIVEANQYLGPDTITFNISGQGPLSIAPLSPMPAITDPVNIDATTQPDYSGFPSIEIDGSSAGGQTNGLTIAAAGAGSTIQGLAINRFGGSGIAIQGGGNNKILADESGTSLSGSTSAGNGFDGVLIDGSSNNTIGGTSLTARNLISGNGIAGVEILGPSASANLIAANLIGTDRSGATALPNQHGGVYVDGASGNTIGGGTTGAVNVISGNSGAGVQISGPGASDNLVQGNLIGTDSTGAVALGNQLDGVYLENAPHNTVGGSASGKPANVISGNHLTGIRIAGPNATGNQVENNDVGTDQTGEHAIGNTFDGIFVLNAPSNTIGGPGAGNLISDNGGEGIQLDGRQATANQVAGNLIGTDAAGTQAIGNAHDGVYINNAPGNTVGGTSQGARNLISGNSLVGVRFSGRGATRNIVQGNGIGTDVNGAPTLPNAIGVFLGGTHGNTIGGPGPAQNQVVQGSTRGLSMRSVNGRGGSRTSFQSSAPTVTGVTPTLDGRSHLASLVVQFNTALDPMRAQDIGNYRLRLGGRARGGGFKAHGAVTIPLQSAVYDPSSQSVTLTLAEPLSGTSPIQLTVIGRSRRGITDAQGNRLGGQRGSNDFTVLSSA